MSDRVPPDDDRADDRALAAEHVLGLLSPPEAAAFEARLVADPALRALTAAWTEDLVALAMAVPDVPPPPGAEAALMRRLFPEERRRGWLARLGLLPALLGGGVAALLVLWVATSGVLGPRGPAFQARIAAEDGSFAVAALFDPRSSTLAIERTAGEEAPGRSQELWIIPAGLDPISIGVVPAGGVGSVPIEPELVPHLAGGQLAVTDEPSGGSPTGGPTGALLAAGPITTL